MGKVIAIDGPSGAGKSTIARLLAQRLGFVYLDTGALYRAAALLFLKQGIRPEDDDGKLGEALRSAKIGFQQGKVLLDGRDVSSDIRTPEIGHYSSVFSARKVVRDYLLNAQREASLREDLVAEGRDTTTVVFPGAYKKFYLEASIIERTRRRFQQLKEMGIAATEEEARRDVVERDQRDQSRDVAPLMKAPDAVVIDSSDEDIEQVLKQMIEVIGKG